MKKCTIPGLFVFFVLSCSQNHGSSSDNRYFDDASCTDANCIERDSDSTDSDTKDSDTEQYGGDDAGLYQENDDATDSGIGNADELDGGFYGSTDDSEFPQDSTDDTGTEDSDSCIDETEKPGLRFDGLYTSRRENDSSSRILRFYDDGLVVGGTTTADLEKAAVFINRDQLSQYAGKGKWKVSGTKITFTLTAQGLSGDVVVDYEGKIQNNDLLLNTYSYATSNKCVGRKFCFMPCDFGENISCCGSVESCIVTYFCTSDY